MENRIISTHFWILATCWFALQVIQAIFTPIHYDEAYYWMFSQQLAWGYFDHPPAAAFLIWLSDIFFDGTLGVRLMTILGQLLTFFILWKLVDDKKDKKVPFILLLFLLPFFHIYGFITTPDVPLLLSAAVFLWCYKSVLKNENWLSYFLWGVSMAALLYSKYHGVLLIFFILLSNPKLFLNPKTYFAGIVGILLWTPHLYFQYANDFPSFRYHLSERIGKTKWYFPLEYLGNVILIFNPFLLAFLYKSFQFKGKDLFEKGLIYIFYGFLIFFGIQTFRGHVQPQWVVLCYFPLVLLLLSSWKSGDNKKLITVLWFSMPIMIALRVFLIFNLIPNNLGVHGFREKMAEVSQGADGNQVMFINSYENAALFSWYEKQPFTHSYNTAKSRKNQFNIWDSERTFFDKKIFLVGEGTPDSLSTEYGTYSASILHYAPFEKLRFDLQNLALQSSNGLKFDLKITNPYEKKLTIGFEEIEVYAHLFVGKRISGEPILLKLNSFELSLEGDSVLQNIQLIVPQLIENEATHIGFSTAKEPWPPSSVLKRYKLR